MKILVLFAFVLVAAYCGNSYNYTLWDNWHNVPTTWVPSPANTVSSISTLSGWTRNGPTSKHPSGRFNNYTNVYTQYLYWDNSDPNVIIMCSPKYYLYNEYQCKLDPYYKFIGMPTYCQPNYFNHPDMPSICDPVNVYLDGTPCCYDGMSFEKTFSSKDPYSTPLW